MSEAIAQGTVLAADVRGELAESCELAVAADSRARAFSRLTFFSRRAAACAAAMAMAGLACPRELLID